MRYHQPGGKFRLAPWIIERMPPHRVYVEPYGGAGSVLLRKPRSFAEVFNDLDSEVVNVFRVLRDPQLAEELRKACTLTPWSRDEFWASYEPTDDPVERARRRIFRSFASHGTTSGRKHRTGFRSRGCRQGATEPMVWSRWPEQVPAFVERFRGVVIEHRDALEVMAQHDGPDTLHYVDPPYPLSTRSSIRRPGEVGGAYRHEMTDEDHRRLAGLLHEVEGMVLVSGYRCELYDELFGDWQREEVAALADGARPRTEVLWFSPTADAARGGLFG